MPTKRRTRPRGLSSGCRAIGLFSYLTVVFDLPQHRVNARTRLNECLCPCRVDHAKNGSSKNGQIRCVGMNFDTPTSPLRVSEDVIATIMFGSLGHWTTDSFPLDATPPTDGQFGEGGNKLRSDVDYWHEADQSMASGNVRYCVA